MDRRIRLRQPARGYRAGSDAVLLAAAVAARPGERVLDVGAGAGAVSLCLAWRCPQVHVTGLERSPEMTALAADNATANGLGERIAMVEGDVANPPAALRQERFDHVMTNPPFYDADAGTLSPEPLKATAHAADAVSLDAWLAFCLKRLKPAGSLTVIHRASHLPDLLARLEGRAGAIVILPLWPLGGRPAKRVIVQARAGSRTPAKLLPGLMLHDGEGDTAEARAILRDGVALSLAAPDGKDL